MGNVKVLICTHKEVRLPRHPFFLPVQAGAALRGRIAGYQPDDEGDNISAKNAHFCELTCHYWAWKNLRGADIVGLNHYRRYFDWERGWPCADKRFVAVDDFLGRDYEFPDVEQLLDKYDMVLPVQRHWRVSNTRQYADYHNESDWEMLRQIIMERSPKYMATFERTMDYSNRGSGYNMFLTRWDLFAEYSEWLFDILFEVERRVPPAADPVQGRIYGYMSERLINVFCACHKLRVKYVPLVMPIEEYREGLNVSGIHGLWRQVVNDVTWRLRG